jgi:transcriptional regulator with XRE-family HTH domain
MAQSILSQRIRRARRLQEWSQAELARRARVHRSCVGHWEGVHGAHPGHLRLAELADILEVSFEWLATGRGPMRLGHNPKDDIPAAYGKLVDDVDTLRLLNAWEGLSLRSRSTVLDVAEQLARLRKPRLSSPSHTVKLDGGLFDDRSGDRIRL